MGFEAENPPDASAANPPGFTAEPSRPKSGQSRLWAYHFFCFFSRFLPPVQPQILRLAPSNQRNSKMFIFPYSSTCFLVV